MQKDGGGEQDGNVEKGVKESLGVRKHEMYSRVSG